MSKDNKNIKPENTTEETSVEEAVAEETPVEESATEETPVEESATEETPVEEADEEETPVEEAAAEETPVVEDLIENQSLDIPFIIGKKIGMTRLFDDEGRSYPVTLIEAGPCYVTQIKSLLKDGYSAVQLGYLDIEQKKLSKPKQGHLKNVKDKYLKYLSEYKMDVSDDISIGGEVNVGSFDLGDLVNVSGSSKGKGFAGHL